MTTKKTLRHTVNEAEKKFEECLDILEPMRQGALHDDFLDLQYKLGRTLFKLSDPYHQVAARRRYLIGRKEQVSDRWFVERQRYLGSYQDVLKHSIGIGKGIGDAFAWLFYQHQPKLLEKHREKQPQLLFPIGVGGTGELALMHNIKELHGCLVLYHSNTSILRMGDFSLINLSKPMSVAGIAEMKTEQVGESAYQSRVEFIGRRDSLSLNLPIKSAKKEQLPPLHPPVEARLRRQMDKLTDAFGPRSEPEKEIKIGGEADIQASELGEALHTAVSEGTGTVRRIGDGLLVAAIPLPSRTLFSRLTVDREQARFGELLPDNLREESEALIQADSKYNTLHVDSIMPDLPGGRHYIPGAMPVFWWPLDAALLKLLLLYRVLVLTVYNPAHLLQKLEEYDFEIETNPDTGELRLRRTTAERLVTVDHLVHFFAHIQQCLMPEDRIAAFVDGIARLVPEEHGPAQATIRLSQGLGPRDDEEIMEFPRFRGQ